MKLIRNFLVAVLVLLLLVPAIRSLGPVTNPAVQVSGNSPATSPNGIVYSSFIGGSGDDYGCAVARDSQNNTIIAGITYSTDFPVTGGAFDTSHNGVSDVFVSKFTENGTLLFSTFIGGSDEETENQGDDSFISHTLSIAVDNADNIVIYGKTSSSDFPVTGGAYDTAYGGGIIDLFIAKLSSDGSDLLFATYLGGEDYDSQGLLNNHLIVLDQDDNIIVAGMTDSSDFPTTANAIDRSHRGVFVSKLSADGSSLLYSTFVSSGFLDSLAVDGEGNIIVAGGGWQSDIISAGILPTVGAYDTTFNGGATDAYITKIAADSSEILWTTLLGGSGWDHVVSVNVDAAGDIYLAGYCNNNSHDFPVTPGASDTAHNGTGDSFIAKLSSNGTELLFSTFHGGNGYDFISGMTMDSDNYIYLAGASSSTDYPVTENAARSAPAGGQDYMVAKMTPDGSFVQYATYLGGSAGEIVPMRFVTWGAPAVPDQATSGDIELVSEDNVIVIGTTNSTDYPTTAGAYSVVNAGGKDAFITQLAWTPLEPPVTPTAPGFDIVSSLTGIVGLTAFSTVIHLIKRKKFKKKRSINQT